MFIEHPLDALAVRPLRCALSRGDRRLSPGDFAASSVSRWVRATTCFLQVCRIFPTASGRSDRDPRGTRDVVLRTRIGGAELTCG
jgi:hypothetical protein